MDENFAQPLKKLAESGIGVAAAPTGGMGLALDGNGNIPAGVLFKDTRSCVMATGFVVVTWPGGTALSDLITVAHGLGRAARVVLVTNVGNTGLNTIPVAGVSFVGYPSFSIQAATIDAQNPLNTAVSNFYWLAIG